MFKFAAHTVYLALAVILAFFWTSSSSLSIYTLQLIAFFIIAFFINKIFLKSKKSQSVDTMDAVIFTVVVMLLICLTGFLASPLFFLIYFLLFGLALIFEPLVTFALTAVVILLFVLIPSQIQPNGIIQLFSLVLITPLAVFFGNEFLKSKQRQEKIKILHEEGVMLEKVIRKEETDALFWMAINLKNTLTGSVDEVSNLLADVGHLTINQKERLQKIKDDLIALLKSGEELENEIDKETD